MMLSHQIRLEPTFKQAQFLAKCAGTARYAWNWALNESQRIYKETGKSADLNALKGAWNTTKPDWVYEVPKDCNQQPFTDLKAAYTNFFKGLRSKRNVGLPRFKRKGKHDAFYLSNDKAKLTEKGLYVPILKKHIKTSEPLRFSGKVMSFRVSKRAGHWFVAVAVEGVHARARTGHGIIGVDLGIKDFAVTSNGEVFSAPKPLKVHLDKLAKAQRILSRREFGSNRREQARHEVARLHYRISNIRKDFLHKVTTQLVRENQVIVLEDLHVKGMLKNRKLSRALSDVGFYEFRRQVEYKSKLYGSEVVLADRFFPSSKTCSACGHKNGELQLSERVWECAACGVVHDRDLNAAMNLRTLGLRETCGETHRTIVDRVTSGLSKVDDSSKLVESISP